MVDPVGGNGQYTYEWSTGSTNYYIAGLEGNVYSVLVTDHKGCQADTSIQVNSSAPISFETEIGNVDCYGNNNGYIEIVNASVFSSIFWTATGETTPRIENLTAGWYVVEVANSEGCVESFPREVKQPSQPLSIQLDSTDIWCAGDQNGTIDITVTGGWATSYEYNWSSPDGIGLISNVSDQINLSGGSYYVTVSDAGHCSVTDSIQVGEPPEFIANIDYNDIGCFGEANGNISIESQGGNGGFSYEWSNGSSDSLLTDLYSGVYMVTVTDSKGCEIFESVEIIEPELLETMISGTDISCYGFNNGIASIDIFGGTAPYDISWAGNPTGQGTDSIYDLAAGYYYVTVTDNHNCITENEIEITEPDELLNNPAFENITCFGYENGEIVLSPTGGVLPYNYQWSHNGTLNNDSAMNLGPGNYEVTVVDYNSCTQVTQIELTQPDPLLANIEKKIISCYGFNDGAFMITMFGGTPEYNYNWDNGFDGAVQDMMEPGIYQLLITDQLGCFIDTTLQLIEPDKLVINPTIQRPTCADIQNGSIELNISGGRTPYSVYWDDGTTEENLYNIRSGIYDVVINDSSMCEIDTTFRIRSAHTTCIDIPTAFTPNGDSYNEKWEIDLGGLYPQAEIEVFDRYGRRVFYSRGYDESQHWDGTYNGKELPMDAYYYVINLKNGSQRLSGVVTIVR